jgi:Uma2 family endonuclease
LKSHQLPGSSASLLAHAQCRTKHNVDTLFFKPEESYVGRQREAPMNVQLPVHMDKAAFLAWVQGLEGRYELANGRVVMMVGASRAHALIVRNLLALLQGQLDSQLWTVLADFGIDAGPETLRYPDVMVERAGGSARDYTTTAPALVAEVLSPSTAKIDLGDKAAEYLRLSSLMTYLVFEQNEYKAHIWTRAADQFPPAPTVIRGRDKILRIEGLNLILPLAAVYVGVEFD